MIQQLRRRALLLAVFGLSILLATAWLIHGDYLLQRYATLRSRIASKLVLGPKQQDVVFPLRIAEGNRHLVDSNGMPFLIHGDTAWSLIADLTREEVEIYLADRKARGFNTLLVSLLEHKFARNAPSDAYGDAPFEEAGNFGTPNDAYFEHAEWVLRRARDAGFLVLLTPAYIGWKGGDHGWWADMLVNDEETLHSYGVYLGKRYGGLGNIVWVNAGDYDPPNKAPVRAVAQGIKHTAPDNLHTAHMAPETNVAAFWTDEDWLDVTSAYTYGSVCPKVRDAYLNATRRPTFLIESAYENEHGAGAERVRRQAYAALLCGAAGHVFGNNPIWHFHHSGVYPAPGDWWQNLGSRGAQSMSHLAKLFAEIPWWQLQPELTSKLMPRGAGEGDNLAIAAKTIDGTMAVIYLPSPRRITVVPNEFASQQISAKWFDPSNGHMKNARSTLENGNLEYVAPRRNAGGDDDWLLILTAAKQTPPN